MYSGLGFYAGLAPAVVGITPYMGLNFAFYEGFRNLIQEPLQRFLSSHKGSATSVISHIVSNGICGALAGGASKFIVYPLDTIKKRLQAQVHYLIHKYHQMISCEYVFLRIYRAH
jgi:solute carrier family 25 (mitochondrial thiamine pyrophosphate transporter), member 19